MSTQLANRLRKVEARHNSRHQKREVYTVIVDEAPTREEHEKRVAEVLAAKGFEPTPEDLVIAHIITKPKHQPEEETAA